MEPGNFNESDIGFFCQLISSRFWLRQKQRMPYQRSWFLSFLPFWSTAFKLTLQHRFITSTLSITKNCPKSRDDVINQLLLRMIVYIAKKWIKCIVRSDFKMKGSQAKPVSEWLIGTSKSRTTKPFSLIESTKRWFYLT